LVLASLAGVIVILGCRSPDTRVAGDPTAAPVDAAALVERVAGLLQDNYLEPEVAGRCAERIWEQLAAEAYVSAHTPQELAEAITADLQAVSHDLHMRVAVAPPPAESAELEGEAKREPAGAHPLLEKLDVYHFEKRGNFGLMEVKWLSGNVGYIDLRAFLDLARVRPKIESAMTFLSDTDAIIIDLRSLVRGGYPETVGYIAGYFFDQPTLLQRIVFPRSGRVDETWTARSHGGPDLSDVPLFILTSEDVFSAAEAFTYGMQTQGRATVVGTSTMGGAHLTRGFRVEPGFDVYVPIGRSVNPVTGGNWEGVGVIPDVPTTAEGALGAALDLARTAADARRAARERDDRDIMLDVEARLLAALGDYGQGSTERGAAELVKALRDGLAGAVLTEDMINDVGYYCLENGFSEAAVVAFRFNAEQFPDSANAHDSLGEALVAVGRPAEAADSYRRALQLDPRLSSSRAALDRLDAEQ
jgi:hypothetical protein